MPLSECLSVASSFPRMGTKREGLKFDEFDGRLCGDIYHWAVGQLDLSLGIPGCSMDPCPTYGNHGHPWPKIRSKIDIGMHFQWGTVRQGSTFPRMTLEAAGS